jgi:hypothetical protein
MARAKPMQPNLDIEPDSPRWESLRTLPCWPAQRSVTLTVGNAISGGYSSMLSMTWAPFNAQAGTTVGFFRPNVTKTRMRPAHSVGSAQVVSVERSRSLCAFSPQAVARCGP